MRLKQLGVSRSYGIAPYPDGNCTASAAVAMATQVTIDVDLQERSTARKRYGLKSRTLPSRGGERIAQVRFCSQRAKPPCQSSIALLSSGVSPARAASPH